MSDSHDVECFPGDVPDAANEIVENNRSRKKKNYSQYFEIRGSGKNKEGLCETCGKDRNGQYLKVIKMTGANTSGLLSHLRYDHKKIYTNFFENKNSKKIDNPKQKLIFNDEVSEHY